MVTLFLAGGGDAEDSKAIDQAFASSLPQDPKIMYVPIAMDGINPSYASCLEWVKSALAPYGIHKIDMTEGLSELTQDKLSGYHGIYIGGGNTYSLLKKIKDSQFGQILTTYLSGGGVVYGGSAGAIILGRNIDTCDHMDAHEAGPVSSAGLNLLHGWSVWCHYTADDKPLVRNYVRKHGERMVMIAEKGGVYSADDGMHVLGDTAYIVKSGNETAFEAGSVIGWY